MKTDSQRFPQSFIEWGTASHSAVGEDHAGDQYLVKDFSSGVLTAVVDGLGHGERAFEVADKAITTLSQHPHEPVESLMERCHRALRSSRGVVMSLASFNAKSDSMTWLGVGNVSGVLVRAGQNVDRHYERLFLRGGVVGYRLPTLRPVVFPLSPGDTLLFVTDGIRSGFTDLLTKGNGSLYSNNQGELDKRDMVKTEPQQLAERILNSYSRESDDALVLVVRYLGNNS